MFCRQKMVAERGVKNKRKASGNIEDQIKGNLIEYIRVFVRPNNVTDNCPKIGYFLSGIPYLLN